MKAGKAVGWSELVKSDGLNVEECEVVGVLHRDEARGR